MWVGRVCLARGSVHQQKGELQHITTVALPHGTTLHSSSRRRLTTFKSPDLYFVSHNAGTRKAEEVFCYTNDTKTYIHMHYYHPVGISGSNLTTNIP
jgi:hypothetical protein